jgi:hypothetical protein
MTTLPNEPVQIEQFAPTLNPQFRGADPAALLHAAGAWLEAHPDVAVVALNLTNFDLLGHNPHGNGFLLDLVVDQGARRIDQ